MKIRGLREDEPEAPGAARRGSIAMTKAEFTKAVNLLSANSASQPTEEQTEGRLPILWEEVGHLEYERFLVAVKWLVKQPDFKWFPTVGEVLNAIEQTVDREEIAARRRERDRVLYADVLQRYFSSEEYKQVLEFKMPLATGTTNLEIDAERVRIKTAAEKEAEEKERQRYEEWQAEQAKKAGLV